MLDLNLKSQFLSRKKSIAVNLALLTCFLFIVIFRSNFASIDLSVNYWAASINAVPITVLAEGISFAFDASVMALASVVIATTFFVTHHKRDGLLMLSAMGGEAILVSVCKTLIASVRPLNEILPETNYSFPSGHVTGSVVFFGVLTYFAWLHWNSTKVKVTIGGLYVSVVTVVAFDRIYLNVHWFSDVVGAVFLGTLWLAFIVSVFSKTDINIGLRS
jgi:undecaprenyl-diphosphatase